MATLMQMAPCLCADSLTLTALLARNRAAGRADRRRWRPALAALRLPGEAAAVVLLRPLSGSAALAAVSDVMARNAARTAGRRGSACVISGASETVFFTASLYLGAADVEACRAHAVPAALAGLRGGGAGRRRGWSEDRNGKKRLKPLSALDRNRRIEYNNPKWFYMLLTSRCGLARL